jgi:alkylation response protein AidB-like acyl-CoA dehydrogenase
MDKKSIMVVNTCDSTADEAAGTKCRIVDRCLQMHCGYGCINEYEITRPWRDARVQRI